MHDSKLEQDRRIADLLTYTWAAFFERFGRLKDVQREAIPEILNGRDMLIASATASGKTEAAVAPLIERLMRGGKQWTILYVCPTRALVNDLFERLTLPLHVLELRLARRTGDHKSTLNGIPNVLITTPESFDSILCRGGRRDGSHPLFDVEGVVLDEIHLLDQTARGEQLRWLLHRLVRVKEFGKKKGKARSDSIQTVGLSATLANPERVAGDFLRDPVVRVVSGSREIEVLGDERRLQTVEDCLPPYLAQSNRREKILVFCQTRKRVDGLTTILKQSLRDSTYVVRAHHGSLAQKEREGAEQTIKTSEACVLVATSTLEIGVDIGDIDLVVLDGPALSVSSLLQRIGRGNRRTDRTRVLICGRNEGEKLIHRAMIDAGRAGRIGYVGGGPQLAVSMQQTASYIFQSPHKRRARSAILELVGQCLPEVDKEQLLTHLIGAGEFDADAKGIRLGDDWRDWSAGARIHSNIERPLGVSVVDERTGQSIAHGIDYRGGRGLSLAGSQFDAKRLKGRNLEVQRTNSELPEGAWSYLSSRGAPSDGQPEAVREYLGVPPNCWPILTIMDVRYVFHFGGVRRQCVLELIGQRHDYRLEANNWFVVQPLLVRERPEWIERVTVEDIERHVRNSLSTLEVRLGRPGANRRLPDELRVREVMGWLDLPAELDRVKQAVWSLEEGRKHEALLSELLSI